MNEALAQEVERRVRSSEEIGSSEGELAVPQELKDMRRAMKAATADGWQPCSCRDADTATFDDRRVKNGCRGGRERRIQKFESTEHQTTNSDENMVGGEQK